MDPWLPSLFPQAPSIKTHRKELKDRIAEHQERMAQITKPSWANPRVKTVSRPDSDAEDDDS